MYETGTVNSAKISRIFDKVKLPIILLKKVKKLYKNLPIKQKLLLILNIQVILPLIFIGLMSYMISEHIIEKKSIEYTQDILQVMELRLKDYVNSLTEESQNLLYENQIYSALINNESIKKDSKQEFAVRSDITNILKKRVIKSGNEIKYICIMPNNRQITSSDLPKNSMDNTSDLFKSSTGYYYSEDNSNRASIWDIIPSYNQILAKARQAKGKIIWYFDIKNKKVNNIFLARTMYNIDNFEQEIGLMIIMVKKEFVESIYSDLETEGMQNIAVMTPENTQIVSRNPNNEYLNDRSLMAAIKGQRGYLIDNRQDTLVSFIKMKDPGWGIIAYIPLKVLYKDIKVLRQWIILLSLLSVIILSLLSIFMAVDIVKPINRLVKAMEKIQKGESGAYIEIDRKDELGYLHKTFNKMVKEMNHLVNWIYREQITRKEAEIKALQSQINPHFLFNTLESINWMAQLNNVPEISDTVSDLSSLMEVNMGKGNKLIPLEEEFAYADKYISLLKRRFEDRIDMVKNVQPETLKIEIPRLLIQPLIENAVYHGVERSRDKGIINLNTRIEDESIVIEVIDNGVGIKEEELEELNKKLSIDNDTYFKNSSTQKSKSIGIENVNRRIKLFYGEQYGLKIESQFGKYTKVIVAIPLRSELQEGYYVQSVDN